jgi:hypothetical protein
MSARARLAWRRSIAVGPAIGDFVPSWADKALDLPRRGQNLAANGRDEPVEALM